MTVPVLPDLSSLAVLLVTLAVAGFVRGFSGFGAGMIAMPLMSAVLGPRVAVVLFSLTDFVLTIPMLFPAFRKADWSTVLPAAIAAFLTVPIGTYILTIVDPQIVRWAISCIVLGMLALLMSGYRYRGSPKAPVSASIGVVAGLFSGAAGVAGPPVVTYWMSGPADKSVLRANLIAFFFFSASSSLVSYTIAGLFTVDVLAMFIMAAPVYAVCVWLGTKCLNIASEKQFRGVAFGLIVIAAIIGLPALDSILRGG